MAKGSGSLRGSRNPIVWAFRTVSFSSGRKRNEQVKGYELAVGNDDDTHGWFRYHVLFRGDVVYSTEWYWE